MMQTVYGLGEVIKINWDYGVKVRLRDGCICWFKWYEVNF